MVQSRKEEGGRGGRQGEKLAVQLGVFAVVASALHVVDRYSTTLLDLRCEPLNVAQGAMLIFSVAVMM